MIPWVSCRPALPLIRLAAFLNINRVSKQTSTFVKVDLTAIVSWIQLLLEGKTPCCHVPVFRLSINIHGVLIEYFWKRRHHASVGSHCCWKRRIQPRICWVCCNKQCCCCWKGRHQAIILTENCWKERRCAGVFDWILLEGKTSEVLGVE